MQYKTKEIMKKSNDNSGRFVVEFLMKTENWHEHRIDKIMNILTDYYQQKQRFLLAKYNEYLANTAEGKALTDAIEEAKAISEDESVSKEDKKSAWNKVTSARKAFHEYLKTIKYKTSNYGFFSSLGCEMHFANKDYSKSATKKMMSEHGINSKMIQYLAQCAGSAWEKKLNTNNKDINIDVYKSVDIFKSRLCGKFVTGFRYSADDHSITTTDIKSKNDTPMTIKFVVDKNSVYEKEALKNEVRNIAIVRKQIRGKNKYYVQFTFAGHPYNKGRNIGSGTGAIDPSPSNKTTLYSSDKGVCQRLSLALDVSEDEKRLSRLLRKMDRSRRANNPDNYNTDGTIKKQKKLVWKKSKNGKNTEAEYADIRRKFAVKRKINHNIIANELIAMFNVIKVEKNSYKSMQARCKETKKNKNGKFLSKRRYGKSIMNNAPAMLYTIIENKLGRYPTGRYVEVPSGTGCTQYDFTNSEFTKHPVNERTITTSDGHIHDRDAIAAFNIYHSKETTRKRAIKNKDNFDNDAMKADYERFRVLEANLL